MLDVEWQRVASTDMKLLFTPALQQTDGTTHLLFLLYLRHPRGMRTAMMSRI